MARNKNWCLVLLDAARIVDGRDIDAEHGYASTLPVPTQSRGRKSKNSKVHNARNMHNELEKTRRANLRRHLERLKELVPLGSSLTRHTTLGLLNKSTSFIKSLEIEADRRLVEREHLLRDHRILLQQLSELKNYQYRDRDENSPVTTCSLSSEQDDVDVTGASDGDDQNSNLSSASSLPPSSSSSTAEDAWNLQLRS